MKNNLSIWGLPLLVVLLAALQISSHFHELSSEDSVSYLDIGDAYFRGDLKTAINSYWSPLYSWILGLVLFVYRPSMQFEFFVVQLTNLLIFIATVASFEFFLHRLTLFHARTRSPGFGQDNYPKDETAARWIFRAAAYTVFLQASFKWNRTSAVTPDMCMAALVYTASGLCLSITHDESKWKNYAWLGTILALAYLAKAPLFMLAFVFLLSPLLVCAIKPRMTSFTIGLFAFLVISSLYVMAISSQKGHFTIGTAGKLNYAWKVNPDQRMIPGMHWQGGPEGSGVPTHPTRKVHDSPAVFEFAQPVGGTYPPWYDPSFWMEGLTSQFNVKRQVTIIIRNSIFYLKTFGPAGLLALFLLIPGRNAGEIFVALRRASVLMIPALAALFLLMLTTDFTEATYAPQPKTRMPGPFFVLLFCGLAGNPIAASVKRDRVRALLVAMTLLVVTATTAYDVVLDHMDAGAQTQSRNLLIAETVKGMGIKPGDPVAIIGKEFRHIYWARLAKVRIVAEVPWPGDSWTQEQETRVMQILRQTGAVAVVNASRIVLRQHTPKTISATGYEIILYTNSSTEP